MSIFVEEPVSLPVKVGSKLKSDPVGSDGEEVWWVVDLGEVFVLFSEEGSDITLSTSLCLNCAHGGCDCETILQKKLLALGWKPEGSHSGLLCGF